MSLKDLPELESALQPTYRVLRELGGGGMSRGFLAEEGARGREVVIKVLPPEMAAGVSTDRFRREMQLVARLQHPHIVPVLSTGSAGGILYYVMPFIKGESLRARLSREVTLPIDESARLLREVADALEFAHGQGVVHRDIKPDNVLLSSGHALVTDFGVAKALGVGGSDAQGGGLTSVGMALGTPTYMAPEQAAADPHTDHRADIYALGAMAYEMLAGQPPFVAPTPQALIAAHFSKAPESLRASRSTVPAVLDELVMRCLAKSPSDRFQKSAELLPILDSVSHPSLIATAGAMPSAAGTEISRRNLLAASAVIAAIAALAMREFLGLPNWFTVALVAGFLGVAGALMRFTGRRRSAAGYAFTAMFALAVGWVGLRTLGIGPFVTLLNAGTISERDRILVAEFANSTPDSTLGRALTEALTIDLSQSRVIRLMPPADIQAALVRMQRPASTKLTGEVATEVAAREGVKVIVAGEVAPFASGYTISAKVLDQKGATLYATRATANGAADIIPSLEKVSMDLRTRIGESVRSIRANPSLEQVSTTSLEALRLYSRAVRSRQVGDQEDRTALFRQAIALDSSFAMAWRGLYGELVNNRGDVAQLDEAAQGMARYLDRLPAIEVLRVKSVQAQRLGELEKVVELGRQILASWPDDPQATNQVGLYLRALGRYAESEAAFAPAVEAGWASSGMHYNLVTAQIAQGKFDATRRTLELMSKRMPGASNTLQASYFLASSEYRFDAALAAAESLTKQNVASRYWGNLYLAEVQGLRGQLRASERSWNAAAQAQIDQQSPGNALLERLSWMRADFELRGDTADTRRRLDAALAASPISGIAVASRPYGDLVRLRVLIGQRDEARKLIAEYDREVPERLKRDDTRMARARAQLALAEGKPREAIALVKSSRCGGCTASIIGKAYEDLKLPDSAIVAWEQGLGPAPYGSDFRNWRPEVVPRAMFRLGQLYEQMGQRDSAKARYASFVDLWENADAPLQPAVQAARDRLKALAVEAPPKR